LLRHGLLKECVKAASRPARRPENEGKMKSIAVGSTKGKVSKR
jgi:hypothetical protein